MLATIVAITILGGLLPVNAAPNDITTFAGNPAQGDGGPATSASLQQPQDVAVGPGGEVYVADAWNHRIRKITAGTITTVAGIGTSGFSGDGGPATSAQLRFPSGIWVDGSGNLYIADSGNHRVRKVDTSGTITTVAGNGISGFSGDGGPATSANLNSPYDVVVDSSGNLYVSDNNNHRIRRINTAGTISTYAGNGVEGYSGDGGAATAAALNDPSGVALDTSGLLYIADRDNNRIRRVSAGGIISTVAGNGFAGSSGDGGAATAARLDTPTGVAVDSSGNYYIADSDNDKVRRVTAAGTISTYAGSGFPGFSGDGGAATAATLSEPTGVAVVASGVYIADYDNHRIRFVNGSGTISTYAGVAHFGGDGGPAAQALLNRPIGVAADGAGNVYIADWFNNRIRKVNSSGIISTVAGTGTAGFSGDGGPATSAQISFPVDVAVDSTGNLYIADQFNNRIRKVNSSGIISTVAGTGTAGFSGDGGPATSAQIDSPSGVGVDSSGQFFIADFDNDRIRKVNTGGTITTVAGNGIAGYSGDGGLATAAQLNEPVDVAIDGGGQLFIADYSNYRIRRVNAGGTITTVAGNGIFGFSGDGGVATSASLSLPVGVAVDPVGNIFIADSWNGRIRKVNTGGTITTVAGNGNFGFAGDGGPAVSGEMAFPARVALDPAGNFYIADTFNDRIRKVEGLGSLPAPTFTGTTPASPANDNAPRVLGTSDAGTTVTVYTAASCTGPVAASGTAAAFASPGLTVSVGDDSTTSFYATATDGVGNVSACSVAPAIYVEDSTPPAAPSITSSPSSPGSVTIPSWSFSADAGATTECELTRGATVISAYAPCTSPKSYDLGGQPDGDYTFRVRATDAAGNLGSAASNTYTLDTTPPGVPVITVAPSSPGNGLSPAWSFTSDAGTTTECELTRGATVISAYASCTSPKSYGLGGEPDGDYTFRVRALDGAGNTSAPASHTYTLDTTNPAAPAIDSSPSSPGNSTSPAWGFTTEAGSTGECQLTRGATVVSAWAPCASPKVYDLSAEPDGDYDFSVRAVDPAGNTGPAASSSYTLDTTAPGVMITSSPPSPDNDLNPSWSFSTEAGAALECELRRGATVVSPWGACGSPTSYDLTAQGDGAYTFSVRATDAAGNTSGPSSSVYVLDTTPPVVSIDSGPAPVSSERNPVWSFSSEAGATTECELSSTAGVLQPFAPCASPQGYDLTGQPDDTYTFSVRATDPTGNLGPASSSGYYLDTSGPASSITSSPSSPGNTRSPSWSFTAEAGATTECELSAGASILSPYAPCASPTSFSLSGQPDGDYTFSVQATDTAGNTGAPASNTYTLDATAPAAPTITSAPASPGSSQSPSWSFTTELGATTECELSRSGVVLSAWGSCLSPAVYDLTGQPDGDYTFRVRATDGVGNTSPATVSVFTLDTTGPSVNVVLPSSPGNDPTPTWSFSTEAGATAECELSSGAGVLQPFAPCSSPVTYDLAGRPDGGYTVRIRATDAVGNTGPATSSSYVLDTAGPAVTIVSGPQSPGSGKTPSWSFTTEAGATAECELSRGTTVLHALAPCASPKGYDITGEPDGTYTFRVRATDTAGNTGPAANATYAYDGTAPAVPVITSAPASPGTATSVTWAFSVEAGASAECELTRDATVVRPFAACGSPKSYGIGGEPDGNYTFRVRAIDAMGNTSSPAVSTYTLDTTGPDVAITSAPTSPGQLTDPTWAFTVEVGATTRCSLARGGTELSPPSSCTSPVSFDLAGEPDDTYTFRASATDPLGNTGPVASSTYVLARAPQGGGGGEDDGKGGNKDKDDDGGTGSDVVAEQPTGTTDPVSQPEEGSAVVAPVDVTDRRNDRGDRGPARESSADEEPTEDLVPSPEAVRGLAEATTSRPGMLGELLGKVRTLAASLLEQPVFPLSLISVVIGFLVLQSRIDRRDPKLALAPIYPDPHLYFDPQDAPGKDR